MDVRLAAQVDPEPGEGLLERRDQPLGFEQLVEVGRAEEARQVRPPELAEGGKRGSLELPVEHRPIAVRGLLQEAIRLPAKPLEVDPAQLSVGVGIAGPAELRADLVRAAESLAVDG